MVLNKIGAMGICAGAGYTANAAINDRRIKAEGTVSAVNIGSMFRNRWENNIRDADAMPALDGGSQARTADAGGQPPPQHWVSLVLFLTSVASKTFQIEKSGTSGNVLSRWRGWAR
ncbi:hypothetical protein [Pseudoduganella violacea]|uniref:Uncharacterized protein n=1 Tax=Pseudoduganella violacea TaxID=1715466 RepID=A0A7W5BEK9_9BURK|nr:hypothetical protein [Pseudoduganella violacea]MBB3121704.1 hypothetical protein [Pseudoduganella violacea]